MEKLEKRFVKASWKGPTSTLKRCLDLGIDPDFRDRSRTALGWSALYGNVERIRLLIDAGADVNHCENGGTTPLILAASNGHLDAVKLLVDAGADTTAKDDRGMTAYAATLHMMRCNDDYCYNDVLAFLSNYPS